MVTEYYEILCTYIPNYIRTRFIVDWTIYILQQTIEKGRQSFWHEKKFERYEWHKEVRQIDSLENVEIQSFLILATVVYLLKTNRICRRNTI